MCVCVCVCVCARVRARACVRACVLCYQTIWETLETRHCTVYVIRMCQAYYSAMVLSFIETICVFTYVEMFHLWLY